MPQICSSKQIDPTDLWEQIDAIEKRGADRCHKSTPPVACLLLWVDQCHRLRSHIYSSNNGFAPNLLLRGRRSSKFTSPPSAPNMLLEEKEKMKNGIFQFRQAVEDCNLMDLGFNGPRHTWNNKREGKSNVQERLDRFLTND
ncbi:hypothetical protein QYF36_006836 [Acer negundo]|nr:hypothetical protein QYF36_006836 [Acer negundo]